MALEGVLDALNTVFDIVGTTGNADLIAEVAKHLDAIDSLVKAAQEASRAGAPGCSLDGGYCESCAG